MASTVGYDERKYDLSTANQPATGWLARSWHWVYERTTFFRVHLTAFVLVPLIMSGIFYACNGRFRVHFVDALFLCYSAMTGTGLGTVNMSTLTPFQQFQLYFLMGSGTQTTVSWIMVLIRRRYIYTECTYVYWRRQRPTREELANISSPRNARKMDANPDVEITRPTPNPTPLQTRKATVHDANSRREKSAEDERFFDGEVLSSSPKSLNVDLPPNSPFSLPNAWHVTSSPLSMESIRQRRVLSFQDPSQPLPRRRTTVLGARNGPFPSHVPGIENKYQGLGGFPGPIEVMQGIAKRFAPSAYRKFERSMTLPSTTTLDFKGNSVKSGRNSNFRTETLSDDELEEIGGVEYRAVNLLCYLIPVYFVGVQLIAFLVFAPWLSATKQYDHVFQEQPRLVSKPWYSLFLTMSAYSGTGLDLVDTAMLQFQEAYPMIFGVMFVLLAGNHAQPLLLRFIMYMGGIAIYGAGLGIAPNPQVSLGASSCYLYLFPSAQTWFLFIVLCCLSAIEWLAFGILNLGLPVLKDLPIGTRVIAGLFQGIAVRASGLTIVVIGNLAPAVQFLYIVLMYIAVYPVGMCIRATNVYEEQSLGIFEEQEVDLQENLQTLELRERVGRYLGWHLRQQLSVDIWWLVWGIFVVTIIERGNIMNPDKPYIAIFPIMFELVSAFAGIGLSLGFPGDNYSLVGAMRPLSKLVVIVIMIRGRHRGLPVAVDRAVLLPSELKTAPKNKADDVRSTNNDGPTQDSMSINASNH